jgi:type IV pilus assembly protein PilV
MEIILIVTNRNISARHASKKAQPRNQGGFTLIEALIAFVILSVGLLGIVSLQAMSKQSQHQAVQSARAVSMADDIVERIRINPGALLEYVTGTTPVSITTEPTPDCQATACDPNELADHNLWAWEQTMEGAMMTTAAGNAGGLINPKGCILFTPIPGKVRTGLLNVIIQWQGLHSSTDAVQAGEVACGGAAATGDITRRQVSVNTFVIDEQEL